MIRGHGDRLLAAFLTAFLHLCALMPRSLRVLTGNLLGDFAMLVPRARRVARVNLALAFPEKQKNERRQLLRAHFHQLGQAFVELGPLWFWPKERSLGLIREVQGVEAVDQALAEGNGVILFTAHLGAWEAAVQYIGQRWPVTVLYMATRNAAINRQMVAGRGRTGARLVAKEGGIRPLLQALQKEEVVGVLPDQNVGPKEGVFAPFFGRPACTTPLLARLAQRRGSPVFGLFSYRLPAGHGFRIEIRPMPTGFPSGDDVQDASEMNAMLEEAIRKAPEQYWWVHRRFKDYARDWGYPY